MKKKNIYIFKNLTEIPFFSLSNKTSTTASVQKLCHVIWSKAIWLTKGATTLSTNDSQHNDIQHYDTQHNDIQHNDNKVIATLSIITHHNDIQHNDTQHNIIVIQNSA
jgi:hypothetical protein